MEVRERAVSFGTEAAGALQWREAAGERLGHGGRMVVHELAEVWKPSPRASRWSAKMLGPSSGWMSSNWSSPCQASAWRSENATSRRGSASPDRGGSSRYAVHGPIPSWSLQCRTASSRSWTTNATCLMSGRGAGRLTLVSALSEQPIARRRDPGRPRSCHRRRRLSEPSPPRSRDSTIAQTAATASSPPRPSTSGGRPSATARRSRPARSRSAPRRPRRTGGRTPFPSDRIARRSRRRARSRRARAAARRR